MLYLLFSHSIVSNSFRPCGLQLAKLPYPPLSPASVAPTLHALNLSQHQGLIHWLSCLYQVAKELELQLQHHSLNIQGWFSLRLTGLISCSPRDPQESSLSNTTVGKHSLAVSLLYGPTLSSLHDYWRNHNCDYMGLCW